MVAVTGPYFVGNTSPRCLVRRNCGPEQILRCGCTQADDELRTNGGDLRFEPWAAGRNFKRVWLLVQPDFAPRFPLEMLHRIGDVDLGAIDAGGLQALIKQLTGRPNKRLSLLIFAITRLFAHQKNSGMGSAFAKNDLGRIAI